MSKKITVEFELTEDKDIYAYESLIDMGYDMGGLLLESMYNKMRETREWLEDADKRTLIDDQFGNPQMVLIDGLVEHIQSEYGDDYICEWDSEIERVRVTSKDGSCCCHLINGNHGCNCKTKRG